MKLPTSQDIYNRILHDPGLDPAAFTIGYEDRTRGIVERAFVAWKQSVPWHRIRYYRLGDTRVWDRELRIDHLDAHRQSTPRPSTPRPSTLFNLPTQPFQEGGWTLVAPSPSEAPVQAPSTLRILSLNVLFEIHAPGGFDYAQRWAALVRLLEASHADIIALQEVTPALLGHLLAVPALRETYHFSEGATLRPYGQLLLSRFPMRAHTLEISPGKRLLTAQIPFTTHTLAVGVVHLSSQRAAHGERKRREQLSTLLESFEDASELLVLGDFNLPEGQLFELFSQHQLRDLWRVLHPALPGFTFDPRSNPLAAQTSSTGRPFRYDRIFLRSRSGWLLPEHLELTAQTPVEPAQTPPSDHFALLAQLSLSTPGLAELPPTYETALVILPELGCWPPIQAIREHHDRSFSRWMPHINLIYGFVPASALEAAAKRIAQALSTTAPFDVELARFQSFEHARSCSVWLEPQTEGRPLHHLQKRLQACFPQCDEVTRRGDAGFTPHLTVAQTSSPEAARQAIARWSRDWEPVSFRVDAVAIIARSADTPFEICHVVSLGSAGSDLHATLAAMGWEDSDVQPLRERIQGLAARALGGSARVELTGSHALGVAGPCSDVDWVVVSPRDTALTRMSQQAEQEGLALRAVHEARVPVLRGMIANTPVDIQVTAEPELYPGLGEAEAVMAHVGSRGSRYVVVLRALKAWAMARGIYGAEWGYPGGIAWATLAAWATRISTAHTPEALLLDVLDWLAMWDGEPVALGEPPATTPAHEPLWISSPAAPEINTTRSATRATRDRLLRTLERGAEQVRALRASGAPWDALFTPERIEATHSDALLIHLAASDREALHELRGRAGGELVGLVLTLERFSELDVSVYGWDWSPRAPRPHLGLVWGLSRALTGEELQVITAQVQSWSDGGVKSVACVRARELAGMWRPDV